MGVLFKKQTAVLIFALSPEEEIRRKRILGGKHLFETLTAHTLSTVQKTGLPYFQINGGQQEGNSFGSRFTNAIQQVFAQGYSNVIAIGNDSPGLKSSHIRNAATLLEQHSYVYGPSTDGGCYLMGLKHSYFDQLRFHGLPWQTTALKSAFLKMASTDAASVVGLPYLVDIDAAADVKKCLVVSHTLPIAVFKILSAMANDRGHKPPVLNLLSGSYHYTNVSHNRGSPLCA